MKNRWLTGVAAAALTVAGAVSAQAADLPTRKEAPAPVYVPPPFTWTGFYVGLNIGGIWTTGSHQTQFFTGGFPFLTVENPGSLGGGKSGVIGGGQAGYNWQTGMWVFGIETDFDGTSVSRSASFVGPGIFGPGTDFFTFNGSARLNWLGTTRGRVGFVATPDNRLMLYGTGGVAYGGANANFSFFDAAPPVGAGAFWTGNPSSTRVGWTLGAGVEYAITYNITLKAEYLYVNLGNRTITAVPSAIANTVWPGVFATRQVNFDANIFRVGANYKF